MAWKQVALNGESPSFADLTVTGDLTLDDGGSIKEAGGTAAITIDGSGEVTKIGQDSPSDGQVLSWDNSNSKVVWSAAASGTMSDLSDDSSPQLGANLDTNSHNILIDDAHFIGDENGNEQIVFTTTGSAVNYIQVQNSSTGNTPFISSNGSDTNVDLTLSTKGSGVVKTKQADLKITGSGSAKPGTIVLEEASDNGSNTGTLKPAASLGADRTYTLPDATGTIAMTDSALTGNTSGTAAGLSSTLAVGSGGTGATSLTDGGVLLGSGTGAVTAMSVLADGEMIVGDGTTDPVAESGATLRASIGCDAAGTDNSTDVTLASVTSNYLSISGQAITAGTVPVSLGGTGATSASAAATALGLGTTDSVTFRSGKLLAANDGKAQLTLSADNSDDAGDDWYVTAEADQTFTIGNDKASAGTGVALLTITPNATATDSVVTIAGDLVVNGDTTTVNTSTLEVEDVLITLAKGGNSSTSGAGIIVNNGDGTNEPALMWNNSGTGSEWTIERESNTTKLPIATMSQGTSDGTGANDPVGGFHYNTDGDTLWIRTS